MKEPTEIKLNEIMFSFEEYLNLKGLTRPFCFYKSYKNVKSVCNEILSEYIAITSMFSLMGIIFGFYLKFDNANNKKKIRGIDIMYVDKSNIRLNIRIKITIVYGVDEKEFTQNRYFLYIRYTIYNFI